MGFRSMIKTAKTPLTKEEKSSIKRSGRISLYWVIEILSIFAWFVITLPLISFIGGNLMPQIAFTVGQANHVYSAKMSVTDPGVFIYWTLPTLTIGVAIGIGLAVLGWLLWKLRTRWTRKLRRWAYEGEIGKRRRLRRGGGSSSTS